MEKGGGLLVLLVIQMLLRSVGDGGTGENRDGLRDRVELLGAELVLLRVESVVDFAVRGHVLQVLLGGVEIGNELRLLALGLALFLLMRPRELRFPRNSGTVVADLVLDPVDERLEGVDSF